jgi:hypothetical protein
MSDDTSLYDERYLQARDVCSNCLAVRLVERERARTQGLSAGPVVTHERNRQTTEVDWVESERASESKQLFCECGVPDARTRVWPSSATKRDRVWVGDDRHRQRLRRLLKNALRTAAHKGITVDRKRTIATALDHYASGDSVDAALRAALDTGSAVATVADTAATAD